MADFYYVGIDPDSKGYIAVLNHAREPQAEFKMPLVASSTVINFGEVDTIIKFIDKNFPCAEYFLERPFMVPGRWSKSDNGEWNMLPGQSAKAAATQFENAFTIRGILVANEVRYTLDYAKTWQALMLKGTPSNQKPKVRSFIRCQELWPTVDFKGPRGGDNYGKCDAYLMATYLMMVNVKNFEMHLPRPPLTLTGE